jgi:orotidine-5'-phosphate decarboxylase
VALDLESHQGRLELAHSLSERIPQPGYGFKVNLDAACLVAPGAPPLYQQLAELAELGRPLFLDLKMWNGGRTMTAIAHGLAQHPDLGVEILDVYPHAGASFLRQLRETLVDSPTHLFGLTVLTHYEDADCQELYRRSLSETVRWLAEKNLAAGCQGLVLPPNQLAGVRDLPCLKLCPGIRPAWFADRGANAQLQTTTPQEAVEGGADYLVLGSPVTGSPCPEMAMERVLSEVAGATRGR